MYDVIIAGGGTAGAVAGIAAARHDLNVLIIEKATFLGGSQTGGMVTPMMPTMIYGDPEISQINTEIIQKLETRGHGKGLAFNPEALKFLLEDLYLAAGGHVLYDTQVVEAHENKGYIENITIHNKSGTQTLHASTYIDATGDGDLAYFARCEYFHVEKPPRQAASYRFEIANVETSRLRQFLQERGETETTHDYLYCAYTSEGQWPLADIFQKAVAEQLLLPQDVRYFQFFSIPGKPGALSLNCPEVPFTILGTNAEDLTRGLIAGRKMMTRYVNFLKKYFPGCEQIYISGMASSLGIRESRRITGEYTLTAEDVWSYRKFSDAVVPCNYYMDIHAVSDVVQKEITLKDRPIVPEHKRYFEIPFRCCIPKGKKNLLTAGRCISADFNAHSAIRIQQVCRGIGEFCGHAAFISLQDQTPFNFIDRKKVIQLMDGQIV